MAVTAAAGCRSARAGRRAAPSGARSCLSLAPARTRARRRRARRARACRDIPKPPSSPSPRGPEPPLSGSPRPSSVTDARTTPSRSTTLTTALRRLRVATDVGQRLLDDAVDRALELRIQAPSAVLLGRAVAPVKLAPAKLDLGLDLQAVDRLRPPRERLQRRRQAEIVERGGPELGDQVTQPVDLRAEALEHGVDGRAQSVLVVGGRARWRAAGAARRSPGCSRRGSPAPSACARARAPPSRSADVRSPPSAPPPAAARRSRRTRASACRSGSRKPPSRRSAMISPPPWPSMLSGSTSTARASRPSSCSQRRLRPAGAIQRDRLARQVDLAQRAALHRHDPQPRRSLRRWRPPRAARRAPRSPRAACSRRAARGRDRPSGAAATALIRRAPLPIMKARRLRPSTRATEEGGQGRAPAAAAAPRCG